MSSGLYKAVCYRCSYEGRGTASGCPICHFPMILEPEETPAGGRSLESIFPRGSVRDGAPPLPGVHAEKRKAQLMAEARRERIASRPMPQLERSDVLTMGVLDVDDLASIKIPRFRRGALKLTLLCASAVAAGVVAAVLQSGVL
jgi:hypothetical protein